MKKRLQDNANGIKTYGQEDSTQISGGNLDYIRTNTTGEVPVVTMISKTGDMISFLIAVNRKTGEKLFICIMNLKLLVNNRPHLIAIVKTDIIDSLPCRNKP